MHVFRQYVRVRGPIDGENMLHSSHIINPIVLEIGFPLNRLFRLLVTCAFSFHLSPISTHNIAEKFGRSRIRYRLVVRIQRSHR